MVDPVRSPNGLPRTFYPALLLYHVLPLHAPLTLFVLDAPFGRFAKGDSRWKVNGNISWFCMEIVAPISLLGTIAASSVGLSRPSAILAGLYVTHYVHRAIVSPLVLSPIRSPPNVVVPLVAAVYNVLNATCLAAGLLYFPTDISAGSFWLCVAGWAAGFVGNIYHDEVLNDLRRSPDERLVSNSDEAAMKKDKELGKGRYAIPRGGLFSLVTFPNYLCEWFEWTCFALAAAPAFTIPSPPLTSLPPAVRGVLQYFGLPSRLLHPAWMFFIFLLSSMMPRAIRGHRWYKTTFKDRYPAERKVVFPFIF